MDRNGFTAWVDSIVSTLLTKHGNIAKIIIIIDNATWHNEV